MHPLEDDWSISAFAVFKLLSVEELSLEIRCAARKSTEAAVR